MVGVLRGRRYQVAALKLRGFWPVLDMDKEEDGKHPIVATESTRAVARRKAQELNDGETSARAYAANQWKIYC